MDILENINAPTRELTEADVEAINRGARICLAQDLIEMRKLAERLGMKATARSLEGATHHANIEVNS